MVCLHFAKCLTLRLKKKIMKRLYLLFAIFVLIYSMSACQNNEPPDVQVENQATESNEQLKPSGPLPSGISYGDLVNFTEAFNEIRPKAEAGQQELKEIIESGGLSSEEFNQIQKMRQQPETFNQIPYEPHRKFSEILPKVEAHQVAKEEEMAKIVQQHGFTQERYKEIFVAIQQSRQVQEYFSYIKDSLGIQ